MPNNQQNVFSITIYLLAALVIGVSVLLFHLFDENFLMEPKKLTHLILSVLTFSVLSLAALQSVLLALQDWMLRKKRFLSFFNTLPPIETMETLLFHLIGFGFALLTLLILTSFIFYHHMVSAMLIQKTLFGIASWIVFGVLLWGRLYLGWRGRTLISWTLAGVVLLTLAYFSSKFIIEFL